MTESNLKEMFKMMDACVSAVDKLRTEMRLGFKRIDGELADLRSEFSAVKSEVASLKSEVAGLNERMDEFGLKQDKFELELRRNNRALDKVAGHWIQTDVQIGILEDAVL